MTDGSVNYKNKPAPTVQIALSAKITGIVFWGMVLLGLLVAVYLLQSREDVLVKQYNASVLLVSYQIEQAVEKKHGQTSIRYEVEQVFINANKHYSIEAIEFSFGRKHYAFGQRSVDQDRFISSIHIHDNEGSSVQHAGTSLAIFVPNLKQSIATMRKKMLLVIGSLVFVFGLILQLILNRVLSRPFLNMVDVAEKFANGNKKVRFDENRTDEFGYMAKFINRALDSIFQQQTELEESKKSPV